jgi:hypothetical protein
MQTFLPSRDFAETAAALDNKRLNKQALEAWQIMMTNLKLDPAGNHREPRGWFNHPATKMWRGYEPTLYVYIEALTAEWLSRGYRSTILDKAGETLKTAFSLCLVKTIFAKPSWLEDETRFAQIASSHRTALLVKNYEWYHQFGWPEDSGRVPDSYEYVWGQEN